jgi:hypothetical protein
MTWGNKLNEFVTLMQWMKKEISLIAIMIHTACAGSVRH